MPSLLRYASSTLDISQMLLIGRLPESPSKFILGTAQPLDITDLHWLQDYVS